VKTRSRNFKDTSNVQEFWPSFADVMATIAMILFFLMLLSYIQNVITGHKLDFSLGQLQDTELALDITRDELWIKGLEIGEAETNLELLRDELELMRSEIERTRAEVERGKRDLEVSEMEIENRETEIESQRQIIADSNIELGNLRVRLQEIAVMRLEILNKVKDSIESKLVRYPISGIEGLEGLESVGGADLVTIGDSANIIINETLFFDFGSSQIKEEGKELLDLFAVAFEEILDDEDTRDYIEMINIEGHTDSVGSADANRRLSSERAGAVVNYMMESNPALEEKYARYFGVTGFSKFRPISLGEDEESMQKNRRIEISVVVKDSNISNVISEYLDNYDSETRRR